jgi:hypothetical protein
MGTPGTANGVMMPGTMALGFNAAFKGGVTLTRGAFPRAVLARNPVGVGFVGAGATGGPRTGNAPALNSALMCVSVRRSDERSIAGLPRSALTTPVSVAACLTSAATRSIGLLAPCSRCCVPLLSNAARFVDAAISTALVVSSINRDRC